MSSVLLSCKKEDPPEIVFPDPTLSEPSYDFKDQNLTGQIEGVSFTFTSGKFEYSTWSSNSKLEFYINLYPEMDTNLCDFNELQSNKVLFHTPVEPGLYQLNLDWDNPDSNFTITLYERANVNNIICTVGAYEIVKVDTAARVMEMRIDARFDDNNFINGNCTLSFCK